MEYDVFISYAHIDNVAQKDEVGWIDSFEAALYRYLSGKLGREAKIWRDETNLRGNKLLDETIIRDIKNSQVFIPILSMGFINSKYCGKELDIFYKHAKVIEETSTCIFPVLKSQINDTPDQIQRNLIKYEFRIKDDFGKAYEDLDPSLGVTFRNEFNQKIADLAIDLAQFILAREAEELIVEEEPKLPEEEPELSEAEEVPIIYIAEPSLDLFDKYLEIKRDLEERKNQGKIKFKFLPKELPQETKQIVEKTDEADDYKKKIKEDIEQSRLTVHLIGRRPNNFPPESRQSYLHLETETAAERDGQANFNRLVWIPRNLYSEEELKRVDKDRHKAFVKNILEKGVYNNGLMQDSFEEFKELIQQILKPEEEQHPPELTDKPCIYVMSDQSDLDTVSNLEQKIKAQKCSIFSTRDYWGDPAMHKYHLEYLCNCDAVLIYWDTTPVPWVKIKVQELNKTRGYGRTGNFLGRGVFWEGDIEKRETYTFDEDLDMIKDDENLSKFISKVKSNKEALSQ